MRTEKVKRFDISVTDGAIQGVNSRHTPGTSQCEMKDVCVRYRERVAMRNIPIESIAPNDIRQRAKVTDLQYQANTARRKPSLTVRGGVYHLGW